MRKGIIDYICDYCKNKTKCHPYEIKKGKHIFCSKNCANLFRSKKIKCICSYCGKENWRKPSKIQSNIQNDWRYFCNRDCRRRFFIDHPKINGDGKWIPCDNCGYLRYYASYLIDNRTLKGFFCSTKCANNFQSQKHLPLWKSNAISNYRGPNWKEQRNKAKFRDNYMCRMCGFTDGVLTVHHIKPFKEFDYVINENDNYLLANSLDNLITLCRSCHIKIEKYTISTDDLYSILQFL